MTPIVYGSLFSPFVRKVVMVLAIKQIAYELKALSPLIGAEKQQLLQLSPLGKIPIYQEKDLILPDSSVICAYLEKQYPAIAVYPASNGDYAKALWFEEYADSTVAPTAITIFINTLTAPAMNIPVDKTALDTAVNSKLPAIFNYLNQEIAGKTYFSGDMFSIADISIMVSLMMYFLLNKTIDAEQWPNLAAYVDNMMATESIKTMFEQTVQLFQKKYS